MNQENQAPAKTEEQAQPQAPPQQAGSILDQQYIQAGRFFFSNANEPPMLHPVNRVVGTIGLSLPALVAIVNAIQADRKQWNRWVTERTLRNGVTIQQLRVGIMEFDNQFAGGKRYVGTYFENRPDRSGYIPQQQLHAPELPENPEDEQVDTSGNIKPPEEPKN